MSDIDPGASAINAAGIANALACLVSSDAVGAARFELAVVESGGHVGLMQQVALAGMFMEQFRVRHGASAKWGGELSYLYDVWDSIAHAIWMDLGNMPINQIAESAIVSVMCTDVV